MLFPSTACSAWSSCSPSSPGGKPLRSVPAAICCGSDPDSVLSWFAAWRRLPTTVMESVNRSSPVGEGEFGVQGELVDGVVARSDDPDGDIVRLIDHGDHT